LEVRLLVSVTVFRKTSASLVSSLTTAGMSFSVGPWERSCLMAADLSAVSPWLMARAVERSYPKLLASWMYSSRRAMWVAVVVPRGVILTPLWSDWMREASFIAPVVW